MNVQGGEKKVMKKILTVALSTAMAFSMFASVAFGDTAVTPQQKFDALAAKGIFNGYPDGSAHLEKEMTRAEFAKVITKLLGLKEVTGTLSYKDKGYDAKNWAVPYIEAVTAAGIMQGQDSVKKIFNYNGKVTIQEMATVLTRALKLEVPANPDNNAADWAKGYVQAAINKGLISKDANFKANASRSQLVEAAYAIDQAANITFTYKVVDPSNVEFTLSTGEVVKVKLDTPLVANKETEVKFKDAAGNEYTAKVTYVVTTATKVESVKAENLKQVVVTFDGEVDKASAEDASNYSLTDSSKKFEAASLSADGRSVTLTLQGTKTSDVLTNQKEYKLSFNNVKAGDKVISTTEFKFTPLDNTLPTAVSAQALGNKTVKLTFNEPVYNVNVSDLTIDGKTAVGYADIANNVVILKLYTTLENAEHTIALKNVQDYVPFKSAPQELKFSVVEDTAAPTVASVEKSTFEKVQIKFSEPVDKATVLGSNVYWLQGSVKKYASSNVVQISDDTYEFDFTNNRIQYATALYISGVKDYSGNKIADNTKVDVNPTVDQTRPEVVNAELGDDNKTFTIKFNKALDSTSASASANYILRDADGNVVRSSKSASLQSDGKSVVVTLVQALDQGKSYTLEISGVTDNTLLKNSIIPFTKKFDVADKANPTAAVYKDATNNRIIVNYNKVMNVGGDGSIADAAKYLYSTAAAPTAWKNLPDSTRVVVGADSKSVTLEFDKDDLLVGNIANLRVQLVKDAQGNYLSNLAQDFNNIGNATNPIVTGTVAATATNKLELTYDQNLLAASVSSSDFTVKAGTKTLDVIGATLKDNNVVVLTLADDSLKADGKASNGLDPKVTVAANPRTSTAAGTPIASGAIAVANSEKIAGSLEDVTRDASGNVVLTFDEALAAVAAGSTNELANIATDLIVTNSDGDDIAFTVDHVAGASVYLNVPSVPSVIKVGVKDGVRFLKDANTNVVASVKPVEFAIDATAPTGTGISAQNGGTANTIDAGDKITVSFSEPVLVSNLAAPASAGTGANIAATDASNGYATTFVITLGTAPTLNAGDKITFDKADVVDQHGNAAASNVEFTVPALSQF